MASQSPLIFGLSHLSCMSVEVYGGIGSATVWAFLAFNMHLSQRSAPSTSPPPPTPHCCLFGSAFSALVPGRCRCGSGKGKRSPHFAAVTFIRAGPIGTPRFYCTAPVACNVPGMEPLCGAHRSMHVQCFRSQLTFSTVGPFNQLLPIPMPFRFIEGAASTCCPIADDLETVNTNANRTASH